MVEPATHQIRAFRSEDMASIHQLCCQCFRIPYSLDLIRSYQARARDGFLVATQDEKILGFVIATPPTLSLFGSRTGEIILLAVDPACRHRGVATELLNKAIDLLRGRRARQVKLHVEVGNEPAITLYQKFGFAVESIVRAYYRDGSDAYRMVKNLNDQ